MAVGDALDDIPSSSQLSETGTTRLRRPPTITPKRFTRFFTPRNGSQSSKRTKYVSGAASSLRDITKNGVNRGARSPASNHVKFVQGDCPLGMHTPRTHKRRRLSPVPDSSPFQDLSSPSKQANKGFDLVSIFEDGYGIDACLQAGRNQDDCCTPLSRLPSPLTRLSRGSSALRLLQRSFGGPQVLLRGRIHDTAADWRHAVADFYTSPSDAHDFRQKALPFCTASCNSSSIVAVGDESGGITLVDSARDDGVDFSSSHLYFQPHRNAVMDIAFSSDDYLFATASGDQTSRVIDMRTQQTRYIMAGHMSSVKQIRFQPGNDSILATSSRDGSVQIWDLRCRGTDVPARELTTDRTDLPAAGTRQVVYADTCISIRDAHTNPTSNLGRKSRADIFNVRAEQSSRRNDVSITSIAFLPQGREHLLLSASEADASIKVWDIRGRYSARKGTAVPVSATREPETHLDLRKFGVTSLALSTDGARLYSLCRDSTVYAYSTSHLILGHAPELDNTLSRSRHRPSAAEPRPGLGPLYGLRHPSLHVTSFYIKLALRPARRDRDELLAVGSRDGTPILIPTDEAQFRHRDVEADVDRARQIEAARARHAAEEAETDREDELESDSEQDQDVPHTPSRMVTRSISARRGRDTTPPLQTRHDSEASASTTLPFYDHGVPLVRGHGKEVTSLTFTHDGDLVSVSDDWTARCWRRDQALAGRLRTCGEGEGARWACGWAGGAELDGWDQG